jgi:hypothetical protein
MNNADQEYEYQEPEVDYDAMERGGAGLNIVTLKEGLNVYRILPPFGEAINKNSRFFGFLFAEKYVHWVPVKVDGKSSNRPTGCLKATKDDNCPVCKKSDAYLAAFNKIVDPFSSFNEKKERTVEWAKMPADLAEKAKKLKEAAEKIKWQRHYYYNALTQDGRVVVLKLSKTAGQDLNGELKKCSSQGFNPVSLKAGCFMVLEKKKTGPRPSDVSVKSYPLQATTKTDDGRIVNEVKLSSLESITMKNAKDLYSLYQRKTAEELERALAGDATVFDRPKSAETKSEPVDMSAFASVPVAATTTTAPVTSTGSSGGTLGGVTSIIGSTGGGGAGGAASGSVSVTMQETKPVEVALPQVAVPDPEMEKLIAELDLEN